MTTINAILLMNFHTRFDKSGNEKILIAEVRAMEAIVKQMHFPSLEQCPDWILQRPANMILNGVLLYLKASLMLVTIVTTGIRRT